MIETLEKNFVIVRGQYEKNVSPSYISKINGKEYFLGGYNPFREDTEEWYQLIDIHSYQCISCGVSLEKILLALKKCIIKYNNSAEKFYKYISDTTSDDYYETHFLGKPPLTDKQRTEKCIGRCPRVSPVGREILQGVVDNFGDFMGDEIEKVEREALQFLEENSTLYKRTKKKLKFIKKGNGEENSILLKEDRGGEDNKENFDNKDKHSVLLKPINQNKKRKLKFNKLS